jgi:acyl-CoA dehydrogenase
MRNDDNIVVATAERIFSDLADSQTIIQAGDDSWKAPVWTAMEEAGLPLSWVDDAHGGAGISLGEGFELLRAAGRAALAVPLAETMLAGWLLSTAGISSPSGAMTVAPTNARDRLSMDDQGCISGRARNVGFARDASHVAVLAEQGAAHRIALVALDDCTVRAGVSLAGDGRDELVLDRVRPVASADAPAGFTASSLLLMGSAVRCQQIAGALETMLDISVRYAGERVAFEKKIAKYQAVQHNLARLAGEVAAAVSAANSAADTIEHAQFGADEMLLEVAGAKIRCGEAAETGTGIAHQVHGAIGFTDEHVLHRLSLRALGWRDDFGNESHWAAELGQFIARGGADALWPLVASR